MEWKKRFQHAEENVYELMRHLGDPDLWFMVLTFTQDEIRRAVYEEAPEDGFWYPACLTAGQKLKQGALLGTLKDILWE